MATVSLKLTKADKELSEPKREWPDAKVLAYLLEVRKMPEDKAVSYLRGWKKVREGRSV